jgi:GGDEF domain-containing protein
VILVDNVADAHFLPALARRVEQAIAEPIMEDDITIRIGASVGYAITERHDEDQEALLTRADNAMYAVKRTRGRDLTVSTA